MLCLLPLQADRTNYQSYLVSIVLYRSDSVKKVYDNPANATHSLFVDAVSSDAATNEASDLPGFDFEGDPRSLDGDRDGTATADMG